MVALAAYESARGVEESRSASGLEIKSVGSNDPLSDISGGGGGNDLCLVFLASCRWEGGEVNWNGVTPYV